MFGNVLTKAKNTPHDTTQLRVVRQNKIPLPSRSFERKVLALYHRIETAVPAAGGRIVTIAGMQNTTQGFTYVYELARLAAQQLQRRVLVITTGEAGFAQHVVEGDMSRSWGKMLDSGEIPQQSIHELRVPAIAVTQLNSTPEEFARVVASPALPANLQKLRQQYDLILIDTPSLSDSGEAELLAALADGIVLIVDAGASRWQVMRHAVEELTNRNVTILGVVLNKRRHYIPSFIYNKL